MKSLQELTESLNVSLTLNFEGHKTNTEWNHFAWTAHVSRDGKPVWSGSYKTGVGHVIGRKEVYALKDKATRDNPSHCYPVNTQRGRETWTKPPQVADVLHSLLCDGSAFFDGERFADWASNYGYSDDSISAKATWETCVEIGMTLAPYFTPAELSELREAASNY